jgi:hypothetical protein
MTLNIVTRVGKGGSNDPFLYKVVKGASLEDNDIVDPALEIRLVRIENKITALLREQSVNVTEKHIRAVVGDNTGACKFVSMKISSLSVASVFFQGDGSREFQGKCGCVGM